MTHIEIPVTVTSRLTPGYREAIDHALSLIPQPFRSLVHPHFLTGMDPAYIGLHHYDGTANSSTPSPYSDTAHYADPIHQSASRAQQHPTIVLPRSFPEMLAAYQTQDLASVIVHEFGHVIHYALDCEPELEATTTYAETNHYEAFAEAFECWVYGSSDAWTGHRVAMEFFDRFPR